MTVHSAYSISAVPPDAELRRKTANPSYGRTRPRLVEVAQLAGVSLGTASRALSNSPTVQEKTKRKVRNAAEQIGYVLDATARALALRRSMTIGAVLPSIGNQIYSDFVKALQSQLSSSGFHLLIAAHNDNASEEIAVVDRFIQQGVDGLVLVSSDHRSVALRRIEQARMPYVLAWSIDETHSHPSVGISHRRAMHRVVRYLVELGHRSFAMLSDVPEGNDLAGARIEGVKDALSLADIALSAEALQVGPNSIETGRRLMRTVMEIRPRPTALVCTDDQLAAGALIEARSRGIRIPDQLSISGFYDMDFAALLDPPLTTLEVLTSDIGRSAAQTLLAALSGDTANCRIEIPTILKVRGSTGLAPNSVESASVMQRPNVTRIND